MMRKQPILNAPSQGLASSIRPAAMEPAGIGPFDPILPGMKNARIPANPGVITFKVFNRPSRRVGRRLGQRALFLYCHERLEVQVLVA
jgi:hypothetical protein